MENTKGALSGLRILDLSRVLAGPFCTQMLGDLGAEVIKIEKPGEGDDTRLWGPPFLKDTEGRETTESAYYLSANRSKRSVAIDIKKPEGQKLIQRLAASSDVLIENFKVGGLAKYGLDYEQLKALYPGLIYCSITGFGRNGPLATEPGYDFLAQGMSGLMACTGGPGQPPTKVGVAVSDIITGLYAAIGILSALEHRRKTGQGQLVDVSLLDCSLSALTNIAQYYLTSKNVPPRLGNAHTTIVPYSTFATADGHIIIAVGNDHQFSRLCQELGQAGWAQDDRFARNRDRVTHRDVLTALMQEVLKTKTTAQWLAMFQDADVPAGPVNTMDQVFAMPQIQARGMQIEMHHAPSGQNIDLVGSPLKLSETPPDYTLAPPVRGQHTQEVLREVLGLDAGEIRLLCADGVIEIAGR